MVSSGKDTIFAQSSGLGVAGIAVLRCSGPQVAAVLAVMAAPVPAPRQAALRWILDARSGERLDSGLVLWFPGPDSFTGEDCAEFHVHGSRATVAAVLAALGRMDGLRPALPGEFSMRAFKNGKLDLFEAEALGDLIGAETEAQRRLALRLALGGAGEVIECWRRDIIHLLAHAEALIDFSDEEDVVTSGNARIFLGVDTLALSLAEAIRLSDGARLVRDGVRVVIAGPPNAGKSRLLNRIARRDAAIVSSRPGTTRDIIDVQVELGGLAVLFSDTAGIREATDDEIESIGIARAWSAIGDAHIILWVTAPDAEEEASPPVGMAKLVRVRNKSDLSSDGLRLIRNEMNGLSVSAETGAGVDVLLELIADMARTMADAGDSVVFSRERQLSAARSALIHIRNITLSRELPVETVAEELRAAAFQIGRISGRVDVEDLLDSIFRDFCIGK